MKAETKYRSIGETLTLKEPIKNLKQIEISVSFTSGGMNYFTGTSHPRGYRLHCKPCNVSNGMRESVMLSGNRDSGLAYRICEAPRYSEKTLKALAEQVDAQKVADYYETQNDKAILEYINTLSTPHLTATATGV